eukprot:TRINITY_DN10705_c0_g1_i4.p3 TRINITY_DN10705_c0_g1~~TRINITY_DN10705_c0_g1_i4.p3  ORF type:complete len:127 (+),score=21.43 TRINITY_DN10705_c0_g1_i4:63-443(+)
MIRRPPRSTLSSSSAASDVYKRQVSDYLMENTRIGVDLSKSISSRLADWTASPAEWLQGANAFASFPPGPQLDGSALGQLIRGSAPLPASGTPVAQGPNGQGFHRAPSGPKAVGPVGPGRTVGMHL